MRIHSELEQRRMQQVSSRLFGLFRELSEMTLVGMSTISIDRHVGRYLQRHGMISATVAYRGYPAHCSVSINDVAIHGLPGQRRIARGDIFTVDIAARADGFVTDTAWTFVTPGASRRDEELVSRGWRAVTGLIKAIGPGVTVGDIGTLATAEANAERLSIIPEFVGHGIGRELHEPPVIPFIVEKSGLRNGITARPTTVERGSDFALIPGMIVNIEPVYSSGDTAIEELEDGWGFRLCDRSRTVHFELSVLIGHDCGRVLQFNGMSVSELPREPPFARVT